ncbi:pre-mRNA-splicing factor SPP2 [Fusarium coicis]|nr:pre-mRNA-splicing factor SPP2 [Fusarium coicis]
MSEQSKPPAPRIAIKFGATSSNNNSKKASKPNPSSSLGKRPRPHALGGASDSEDDDYEHRERHEKITGFGVDGAETEHKAKDLRTEKKEYVLARQPNHDWRSEARAQRKSKSSLPEETRAQQNNATIETEPADQDKGIKWGLTIKEKAEDANKDVGSESKEKPISIDDNLKKPPPKRTEDDEALDALLGNKEDDKKIIHPTEEDAHRHDIQGAGETTLDDYEAMPVEEFGAALLRGMGWDGKTGDKVKEVKRRPNRLGLGGTELKGEEDLGGWNQGGNKNRRPRLDEYRREESKRKEGRSREDSYKRERERERERDRDSRHGYRDRDRERDHHRDRDRNREYDRHRSHRDYERRR